jgi:hypothetical protein
MTARDDYPSLAFFADGSSGRDSDLIARRRETAAALDELDELRVELAVAQQEIVLLERQLTEVGE